MGWNSASSPTIGYALSSEEHRPIDLVRYAAMAELHGFEFALISDHFHPWTERQGESGFVWTVIGAIAMATSSLRLGTGVTCPTIRIHPAIIAHAAATAATLMPGRFFLGVGTGEAGFGSRAMAGVVHNWEETLCADVLPACWPG